MFVLKVPEENEGQEMVTVGETDHLGKPNESVMAVRFIGPRAYIVTFERTDPFYIFDLTDPAEPKKLGELEVGPSCLINHIFCYLLAYTFISLHLL